MKTVDQYKSWLLPVFKRNTNWRDFVEAIIDELITLQKTNMGVSNAVGFSGISEQIDFTDAGKWFLVEGTFDLFKGVYIQSIEGFSIDEGNNKLIFSPIGAVVYTSILKYPFVKGQTYTVSFVVDNQVGTNDTLVIRLGSQEETVPLVGGAESIEVTRNFVADDYYLFFTSGNNVTYAINVLQVLGIENSVDDATKWLLVKQHIDYDLATRYILEKMRDSLSFPQVSNLPLEVLRAFLKDYDSFIATQGSELGEIIFFYFLGFSATVRDLYAHRGDYESEFYPYIQQKKNSLLISGTPPDVYGQVLTASSNKYYLDLKPGHQIAGGDRISNQDTGWTPSTVLVTSVVENRVNLERAVSVAVDDILDIYRVFRYAENPDSVNYFKSSHIDVFFKTKYIEGTEVNFPFLEEAFTKYLPVNVIIRFFGYNNEIPEQEFQLIEADFSFDFDRTETIVLDEVPVYPPDDIVYVVAQQAPVTHEDIYGTPVDGYSYTLFYIHPTDPEQHIFIRI